MNADVIFAIDSSGSVGRDNFLLQLDFVRALASNVNVERGSRVGVLQYSNSAQVEFHLNEHGTWQKAKLYILNSVDLIFKYTYL